MKNVISYTIELFVLVLFIALAFLISPTVGWIISGVLVTMTVISLVYLFSTMGFRDTFRFLHAATTNGFYARLFNKYIYKYN